jgi:hypothetical protein
MRPRSVGDRDQVRAVSMTGIPSVQRSIEQAQIIPPMISTESPMHHSKVMTPAAGFSVRKSHGTPKPIGHLGARNSMKSFGDAFPSDSEMVCSDGHLSPL